MSGSATLARLRARTSFVELGARARAAAVLDPGTFRELVAPFDRVHSPWLTMQGIVPQEDDGVVVARGRIEGRPAVAVAVESAFQGGSLGERTVARVSSAGSGGTSAEDRPGLERLVERMLSTAPEAREEEESCR